MPPRRRSSGRGRGLPWPVVLIREVHRGARSNGRRAWTRRSRAADAEQRGPRHRLNTERPFCARDATRLWPDCRRRCVWSTFDAVYDAAEDFDDVYSEIVARLIDLARRPEGVIYAVPGDACVGEASVALLRQAAAQAGLPFTIIPGVSFLEPALAALGLDALDGLQVADALAVASGHHPPLSTDRPALLGQLYSPAVAADVKLTLMNAYPDDHLVTLVHAAGTRGGAARAASAPRARSQPGDRTAHLALHPPRRPARFA